MLSRTKSSTGIRTGKISKESNTETTPRVASPSDLTLRLKNRETTVFLSMSTTATVFDLTSELLTALCDSDVSSDGRLPTNQNIAEDPVPIDIPRSAFDTVSRPSGVPETSLYAAASSTTATVTAFTTPDQVHLAVWRTPHKAQTQAPGQDKHNTSAKAMPLPRCWVALSPPAVCPNTTTGATDKATAAADVSRTTLTELGLVDGDILAFRVSGDSGSTSTTMEDRGHDQLWNVQFPYVR